RPSTPRSPPPGEQRPRRRRARTTGRRNARMLIDTVDVACANCGSTAADEIASATDVEFGTCDNVCRFARCRQCGVTYLRNRPTEAALPVIYPESYYRYAEFLGPVTHFLRSLVQRQRVALLRKLVAGP